MVLSLVALLVLAGPSLAAAKVLLSCSMSGGDVYSLTVKQEGSQIVLRERDINYKDHVRVVSAQEWQSGRLALTVLEKGAVATLGYDKQADAWWLDYDGGNNYLGFQDCDTRGN